MIKVAYWDTEQGARAPRLLGEIKGTPTIRMFKPKRKQKNPESNSEKVVMDYNGERKAADMKTFLEYNMPNYMDRIVFPDDLVQKSLPKATKYGLNTAILFPSKNKTSSMMKFLSTIFRRRLLMVEVVPNDANKKELYSKYGIDSKEDLPVLIIIPNNDAQSDNNNDYIRYQGGQFTRHKLERFLSEHAKKKPVYKPIVTSTKSDETNEETDAEESSKRKVHSEF